jgi:hypothetical protein
MTILRILSLRKVCTARLALSNVPLRYAPPTSRVRYLPRGNVHQCSNPEPYAAVTYRLPAPRHRL